MVYPALLPLMRAPRLPVASTLHTTSEHGVSSITTADARTSAASIRLNWHPCWFKWTCPFRQKTKSGFCGGAITFQTQSISAPTVHLHGRQEYNCTLQLKCLGMEQQTAGIRHFYTYLFFPPPQKPDYADPRGL